MARQVNHRGWFVLVSIESDDRAMCVDVFEDTDGQFGFEHFRADAEDGGSWTPIGAYSSQRFDTPIQAADAAQSAIAWLTTHMQAKTSLNEWRGHRSQDR